MRHGNQDTASHGRLGRTQYVVALATSATASDHVLSSSAGLKPARLSMRILESRSSGFPPQTETIGFHSTVPFAAHSANVTTTPACAATAGFCAPESYDPRGGLSPANAMWPRLAADYLDRSPCFCCDALSRRSNSIDRSTHSFTSSCMRL